MIAYTERVFTGSQVQPKDTRTPLPTNSVKFAGRAALIAALLGSLGVRAIPVALAVTAPVETVALGTILLVKLRRRLRASGGMMAAA